MQAGRVTISSALADQTLPGPTGESNELRLHGRGVMAVLAQGLTPVELARSLAAALVAGNAVAVVGGLVAFAVVFAMNSSIHSYLVLATSDADAVSLNVGFYYMANAAGRLLGTLLSGALFLVGGLPLCLWASSALVALALVYWIQTAAPMPRLQWYGLGFLLGGAVGNGLDRWRQGSVVDFLEFMPIHFPVFNLADVAINVAVACSANSRCSKEARACRSGCHSRLRS